MDIDVLGSLEFDITEAIKDLIAQIKFNRQEISNIKRDIDLLKQEKEN